MMQLFVMTDQLLIRKKAVKRQALNQGVSGALSNPSGGTIASELKDIAVQIRRIGSARAANPETILIDKQEAAERLTALALKLEAAR
jgi:hypothetical protein